ncbi:WD40 repeat domain-containing protein [Streptomyces sp. NBC_01727]|uniref:WD40 repeat domain-containing protein n=1 Tax=Streptomyces sp. NBC_01727 TaxID=2975924 RepID=UPI002E1026C4|nr:hypothetical protein OIE76_43750 [Streptomyces sp. NBC_01727]
MLAVDPSQRVVRLRVVVLYYEIDDHAELPDDASFFLRVLHEYGSGPLGQLVTQDEIRNEAWVDANTRWFVEHVERGAIRNYPFTEADQDRLETGPGYPWDEVRLDEMDPKSAQDLMLSENLRVQGDYNVVVTDPRWIEHLTVGAWWRTAAYPTHADRLLAGEATAIPDLRHPAAVLKPFSREDEPRHLAFSDDGRFLAVNSEEGELVVYDTSGWRECFRARSDDYISSWLMWVPGEPVITLRHHEELRPQLAYDAVRGTSVETPAQSGGLRSVTGRYRTEWASGPAIALLSPTGEKRVVAVGESGGEGNDETELVGPDPYEAVAFSADESRMFVARGARVYVVDPADGLILEVIENDGVKIQSLRVSPGGDYLAVSGESVEMLEVSIRRVSDHQVVARHGIGRRMYPLQTLETAWSPDGRWLVANLVILNRNWEMSHETHIFPIGLPTDPPTKYGPAPSHP